jgi:hypothetical protein
MLGADRFARAFQRGRALSRDEGIALALDDPSVVHPVTTVSPGGSPSSLTRREREVAALVARGLSDREIASEIVVSRGRPRAANPREARTDLANTVGCTVPERVRRRGDGPAPLTLSATAADPAQVRYESCLRVSRHMGVLFRDA